MKPLAEERASGSDNRRSHEGWIDAVVIGSDDTLLIELGSLLGERYRTHSVDSLTDIAASVSAARWIGILDTDALPEPRAAVTRLESQFPHCPLVLISTRPSDWSAAVSRGAAIAVLSRDELAGPRLMEALARAESNLRTEAAHAAAAPKPKAVDSPFAAGSKLRWVVAVVLTGALAGGGWWAMHRHPPSALAASTRSPAMAASTGGTSAPEAAAVPARPQSVLELLSAARSAFRDQKMLLPRTDGEPRGDSALELYAQVISQDPGNDEALDGIRRLFAVGKARIQSDIASGKLDDATRLVQMFRDAGIGSDELADLSASITSARPKLLQSRVEQSIAAGDLDSADQLLGQLTAFGADPGLITQLRHALDAKRLDVQLTGEAGKMRAAIAAGNLLMPPDDALTQLTNMRNISRSHALTLAAGRELQTALLARVTAAAHAEQFDSAQRYLTAASDLGANASLNDARNALRAAIAAAARAATPVAAAPAPKPVVLAPAPVTPAPPPPPAFLAARPTRALSVTYPADHQEAGTVVVQFTLRANGTAADVQVVQSDLPAIFSRIATTAVTRGRFDARALTNGQPAQARLRLRFQPDNQGND